MKYSPYEHSPDADLFPKKPPRRPSLWKWTLAVGFCLFFIYRSTFPVLRLESNPPPEFIYNAPSRHFDCKEPGKRIAEAYWNVAVHSIQNEYPPKKSLPATPPPEFKIDSKLVPSSYNMDVGRAIYWQRLRNLWNERTTWQVSYRWNTDWVGDLLDALGRSASQSMQQFVQSVQRWKYELGQIHSS